MEQQWVCIYCKNSIPYNARYCSHCNAKVPDLKQSFREKAEEEGKEEVKQESQEEEPFFIPRPGDIVGGLFQFTDQALTGEITTDEFEQRIATAISNTDSVFESIYQGVEEIQTDLDDYREQVLSLLENVHFMFMKGLEEIRFFAVDADPSHIRFGRTLTQRAELEYIQIMEMLKYDYSATMNPFEDAPNVIGNLGKRYYKGEINLSTLKEEVNRFEKVTQENKKKGEELVEEGFKIARDFDGKDESTLEKAIDKLKEGADEFSKLIINLHTQEEIKGSMVEILEEERGEEFIKQLTKKDEVGE
ncbi:MAG: hypothetical protein K8T10_06100 [Candidatus Eremiobacteraeota bacterium]|nr:hypothetical protein [Candidatus Eremiobacteraeota bacterium]